MRFGIPLREDDYAVWDPDAEYTIDPDTFQTKGRATPFAGMTVRGRCLVTVCGGKPVYTAEDGKK